MRSLSVLTAIATLWGGALPAAGDFIRGHVFVSGLAVENCRGTEDRIFEYDPVSGQVSQFAVIPQGLCGGLSGLAFTPDGRRLRASVFQSNVILEFDSAGNREIALGAGNGIAGPLGSNNIAYDRAGNFYVVNFWTDQILQFPAGGGPALVYGDRSSGIHAPGPITIPPNGDLYYALDGSRELLRFTGPQTGSLFDRLSTGILSLASDSSGAVYVLAVDGIYRYEEGNPSTREFLASVPLSPVPASIALSPDESELYVTNANALFGIDTETGAVRPLASFSFIPGIVAGSGISVYVPEPSTLLLLAGGVGAISRRRRRAAKHT
jgi:DNA-binding beta-propeller fold protein YncE